MVSDWVGKGAFDRYESGRNIARGSVVAPLGSNHSPASMVPPVSLLYVPLPFRTDFWLRV